MITRRILGHNLATLSLVLPSAALAAEMLVRPALAAEALVRIENFAFVPAKLVVPAGTTVRFANHDDIPHIVVSASGNLAFRSPVLDSDESFARTFDTKGRFAYFCSLHPHMQGEIEVT